MNDPGPLYDHLLLFGYREVLSSLLSVGDWLSMVFNGLRSVFYGPRLLYDGFQYTSPDNAGKTGP